MGTGFAHQNTGCRCFMIKLVRTHPRHLHGARASGFEPRCLSHDRSERGSMFRGVLENAVQGAGSPRPTDRSGTISSSGSSRVEACHPVSHQGTASLSLPSVGRSDDRGDSSRGSQGMTNAGPFENFIQEASQTFDVERDLIRAVIRAESDFNPMAKSPAGAVGLMQLLPSTARDMGVTNLYDPRENILGGTQYLGMLLERYEGNMERALAAYNWGPGNIERAPYRLPDETRAYIQRVLSYLETLTV